MGRDLPHCMDDMVKNMIGDRLKSPLLAPRILTPLVLGPLFTRFLTPLLTPLLTLLLALGFTAPSAHAATQDIQLSDTEILWLRQHPQVSVAFDGNFPPYSFLNDDGVLEGFAVDVFQQLADQVGFDLLIYPEHDWEPLLAAAKRAASNVSTATSLKATRPDIVATMVERGNRRNWFEFTDPYIFKSLVIINRSEDEGIQRREDIAGKTLALVKDYQYVEPLLAEFPSVTALYVDSMLDALNAVSVGDADATISYLGAGHYYRNKYLLSNLKYAAVYDKQNANERIAVRNNAPELAAIIRKGLNAIPEGELQKLRSKWLPVDYMENLAEINLTEQEQAWIKQHRNIRLGIDPEFAPFEFMADGRYQGMTSDYIKLLNQRLNLNMQVVPGITWEQATEGVKAGRVDVLPAVGLTKERQEFLNYTGAYLQFHRVIVNRRDAPFVAGLRDIDHQPVAVQQNSSHHGFLKEQSRVPLALYPTQQEALMAVSGGQASAFVGNVASATYWIRKLNLTNLKIAAPISSQQQSLHFAVRKDWPELQSILQKGLDSISPRQQKLISEKWLSVEYDPVVDYSLLWKWVAAFSVLIIAVFTWNLMLKRQVRRSTSKLDYYANYDHLSGLPNRVLIFDRLKQSLSDAKRNHSKVALLSIDIDELKKINDAFDHQTGDQLIKSVSQRLKSALRDSDSIGHLGADHFLVIQSQFAEAADAALLSEKLLGCFNDSFVIEGHEINISASAGIAIYPDDSSSAEELLKHAGAATSHAKNKLQGGYTFYTQNLMQYVSRGIELDRHMYGALDRQEFVVYYQPKVSAKSGRIVSFEALLRWFNPELGAVSPAEFIPIAEKNGLIESIGYFVVEQALAQLSQWQRQFDKELSMAINLSPVQFRCHDLIPQIESYLLQYNLSGRSVEFEITEGVLLADSPESVEQGGHAHNEHPFVGRKLDQLASLGVSLSMDDFGTGYSSMSYLRKYKFDQLKIDGEFIHDLVNDESDQKLVSATIAMAHGLGMKVVAERIETEAQRDWLANANCDYLQGWLFSKANSPDEITQLLEQQYVLGREEIYD